MTANMVTGSTVRDRRGGLLALGFVVLLLTSEAALTLPDETAADPTVARFYADHRVVIIVLQFVGLVAAGLLAVYAVRLRRVDAAVGTAGAVMALLACAPGLATMALAVVAQPRSPARAGDLNRLLPRADDLLFAGITVFAVTLALRTWRPHRLLAGLAAVVAVSCLARLSLEATGHARSAVESVGPLLFVVLVAVLGVMSTTGRLATRPTTGAPVV